MLHLFRFVCTFILFIYIFTTTSFASFEQKGHGSYFNSRAGGIAGRHVPFAVFNNAAALSAFPHVDLYYRNFYGIKDLNQITLASSFKLQSLPLGIGITRFGNELYTETEWRIAFSYEPFTPIRFGLSFNGYQLAIENYGHASAFGFDIAAAYNVHPRLRIAFVASNLNEPSMGNGGITIWPALTGGLAYTPLEEVELVIDVVRQEPFDFDYRLGLSYHVIEWLSLSAGLRQLTDQFSFGLQIRRGSYRLAYGFEYHMMLGGNHSVSFGYAF